MAMSDGVPHDNELHRTLLTLLSQPENAAFFSASADDKSPLAAFPRAGLFLGLLGFDDGDRDDMSQSCCTEIVRRGLPLFVRPVGKGGLLLALAASCLHPVPAEATGCAAVLPVPRHVGAGEPPGAKEQLFSEAGGRFLLCLPPERQTDARLIANDHGVPLWPLGRTGGRELVVRASEATSSGSSGGVVVGTGGPAFQEVVRLPLSALFEARTQGARISL